jgi:hypothetical protein
MPPCSVYVPIEHQSIDTPTKSREIGGAARAVPVRRASRSVIVTRSGAAAAAAPADVNAQAQAAIAPTIGIEMFACRRALLEQLDVGDHRPKQKRQVEQ